MPYGRLHRSATVILLLTCGGCIIPVGHGPSIKLDDYTFRKTFNDIATNGSPFGIIKPGMTRDRVLKIMNGYFVRGPIDDREFSHGRYASYDYFGGLIGEDKALYIAVWEGPADRTWGIHGRKTRFGMFVRYDEKDCVLESDASEEYLEQ